MSIDLPGSQFDRAKSRWDRLTHFMLNIDNIQCLDEHEGLSATLVKLLEDSNFVQAVPERMVNNGSQMLQQINEQVARQQGLKRFNLTDDGFRYVLLDTPTQVHIVLRKYIEQVMLKNDRIAVELITLIFNLALSEYEQTYKLRTKSSEIKRIVNEDFA